MINKISLKFVLGFLGIVVVALVILVVTSYLNESSVDKDTSEMNIAEGQLVD